ncbi:hypothetical protein [Rheinheimera hassiensis]|uniref:hypothetical protein n=1 Tax=Rheinheimera hassiensis TaxID=1193627 RepID=UPI001F0688FC|nr:hypothetical protein [Rheinheimera hassiensis]
MSNFTHPNVIAVKKQVQLVRYSLKEFSEKAVPTSTKMLNYWVKCFEYEDWQQFIRQVNGHPNDKVDCAIVDQRNFENIATELQSLLPTYDIKQMKWALSASMPNSIQVNTKLIKQLLIRTVPMPSSDELDKLHNLGLIDFQIRSIENSEEKIITGYRPTELGRYKAALQHEKEVGRYLSEIELVEFGLSSNLCKLKSIQRIFTIR